MASAILATNHDHWGNKIYNNNNNNAVNRFRYTQITNPNFRPNLQFTQIENPNPNSNPIGTSNRRQNPSPVTILRSLPSKSPENDVINLEDFVTIDLGEYSKPELRELERRLRAELVQVREIRAKIDTYNVGSDAMLLLPQPIISPWLDKKVAGKKRGSLLYPERETKRVSTKDTPEMEKHLKKIMTRCSQILTKLMKHKFAYIFNTPVDTVKLGLIDYFEIIERPMDLGTVKGKMRKKEYKNPIDFASDVRLVFKNAMTYNPKGQDVHVLAESLLGEFEKMFNPAFHKFEAERVRLVAAMGVNSKRVPYEIENFDKPNFFVEKNKPKQSPKLPKVSEKVQNFVPKVNNDKVKDLEKDVTKSNEENLSREMSFAEKEKLGMELQELPEEDIRGMLAILSKNSKGMAQEGDEIELDFEALDNETLWELYTFVSSLKKVSTESPVMVPMSEVVLDSNMKVDILEEDDVDIGEDIPVTYFPPVEIEKDSSSGSSGDSSSSSGSVSSSGSDSDEDSVQSPFVDPK